MSALSLCTVGPGSDPDLWPWVHLFGRGGGWLRADSTSITGYPPEFPAMELIGSYTLGLCLVKVSRGLKLWNLSAETSISTCCVGTGRGEADLADRFLPMWPCSSESTWVGDREGPSLISHQPTNKKALSRAGETREPVQGKTAGARATT